MLDTYILSDLIRNPRGVLVERLRATELALYAQASRSPVSCASVRSGKARSY